MDTQRILRTLPPPSRAKLRSIRSDEATYEGEHSGLWNAKQAAFARTQEMRAALRHAEAENVQSHHLADLREDLQDAESELAKLTERTLPTPWPRMASVLEWAARHAVGRRFEHFIPDFRPKSGDRIEQWHEQSEAARKLALELESIDTAQLPLADAMRQVERDIDRLAAIGTPDFRPTLRLTHVGVGEAIAQGNVRFPLTFVGEREFINGPALLAWLCRDELVSRAREALKKAARPGALSLADRKKRKGEIGAKLLEAERIEEMLFVAARASRHGASIQRRPGVNMLAVLELREVGSA